jgi:arylsulfatase A
MRFPRPPQVACILGVLLALCFRVSAADSPNIVLIFTDDQGYADVGAFGAKGFTTPHLDQMAKQGRRFTNFHVAQAVCTASRAALLTGCYPNRLGLQGALPPNSKVGLHLEETTIAELVKQKGYATAMYGKWHLGDAPEFLPPSQGFDEYYGVPYSTDMWPHHPAAKPGTYPPLKLVEGSRVINGDVQASDQEQLMTQYTERAVSFIDRNKEGPFFLYLAPNTPHVPLFVSDKFRGKSERGLYGDVIMEIDWAVGQVMEALKRNGLDEKTLVIFTSDNGPWLAYGDHAGSAGPLREGKGTAWSGGTQVPCIMRWPGKIPAGTDCGEMLMTIDLFPTIAKLIGADLPSRKIDGLDVWPLLAGQAGAKNPHDAYWFFYGAGGLHAVWSDGWKLMLPHRYPSLSGRPGGSEGKPAKMDQIQLASEELYHLAEDPSESRNVIADHPERREKLMAIAEQARAALGDPFTKRTGSEIRELGRVPPAPKQ